MKSVAVLLAPGFEEIEAITVIDVLRRADVQVTVAGLVEGAITGSHEITVLPDKSLDQIQPDGFDMVVLPGGLPGTDHLREDPRVITFVQEMAKAGKHTCAICAAPIVLKAAGVANGKAVTSHPAVTFLKRIPLIINTVISRSCVICQSIFQPGWSTVITLKKDRNRRQSKDVDAFRGHLIT